MIRVENITKSYGRIEAVDGISFETVPGEIFGLIGPNGAGKSTTIRMIMNIIAPDSGKILFDDRPITESDKGRIGYLPEERGLYKKVTVNDMLLFLGRLKGAADADIQRNIDTWLDRFDLSQWKHGKISELSKGMSQKVQFISAVAHDPEILFFDEPFAGLDPVSADVLRDSILELSSAGKTILFSTHIMEQAEKLCHRIFLINRGKRVVYGSLEELKDSYGHRTVTVEFDGDGSIFDDLSQIAHVERYPRFVELELSDGADADDLLKAIVGRISIRRFELVSPSLHNIFVQLVGNDNASTNEVKEEANA